MGESTIDGGNDVTHLQSLLVKGRGGKNHVLDALIAASKENDNCVDENVLVMASTGKAASNIC